VAVACDHGSGVGHRGRQAKDGFEIPNKGQEYWLRHLFVLDTNETGQITNITSYWDNATLYTQLGKASLN
jgi:hypothetical protein